MIPENNFYSLVRRFNYNREKEVFLNSLSDEDLLFIRNVICGDSKQTSENQLQAKKIEHFLEKFEEKIRDDLSSWICSTSKSIIDVAEKANIIKTICSSSKITQLHLPFVVSSAALTFEPEIGIYEHLFKEPPLDSINEHKNWQTGQDNYWRQIAYAIQYDLPNPIPEIEIVNSQTSQTEKKQITVAEYVKKYLKDYRAHILKEEKAVYRRNTETFPPITIPQNILTLLKSKLSIQSFLKVKEYKENEVDAKKIQWIISIYEPREAMNLSGLNLSFISESQGETLGHLPGVMAIHLSHNQLTSLPKSFGSCSLWTHLDLSYNQITHFPNSMLRMPLKELIIEGNSCPISAAFFSDLRALKVLCLNRTKIDSPIDFSQLKHLKVLELEYAKDLNFIRHLSGLKKLSITRNALESLPDDIGELKELEELKINRGTLRNIESLGSLKALKMLDLSMNEIQFIPESIGGLSVLHTLILQWNRIDSISDGIAGLSALRNLNLADNRITNIPTVIGNLSNLEHVNLSDNLINEPQESLGHLNKHPTKKPKTLVYFNF